MLFSFCDIWSFRVEAVKADQQAEATFELLQQRRAAGELSSAAFADRIENEVLPICAGWHEHFLRMDELPPYLRGKFELLSRYLAAQEESWKCCADGLRGDSARMKEYRRHATEARRLAEQLGQPAE